MIDEKEYKGVIKILEREIKNKKGKEKEKIRRKINNYYTVAIKRNAKLIFLTLKAYNSLITYAKIIILYLF